MPAVRGIKLTLRRRSKTRRLYISTPFNWHILCTKNAQLSPSPGSLVAQSTMFQPRRPFDPFLRFQQHCRSQNIARRSSTRLKIFQLVIRASRDLGSSYDDLSFAAQLLTPPRHARRPEKVESVYFDAVLSVSQRRAYIYGILAAEDPHLSPPQQPARPKNPELDISAPFYRCRGAILPTVYPQKP